MKHGLLLGWVVVGLLGVGSLVLATESQPVDRYFLSGDGRIELKNAKTKQSATIQYRSRDGRYPQEAQAQIDRLFGIRADEDDHISLRLISALDYLEDQFQIPIVLISGFRSLEYNDNLRANGGGAAKASLHIEGMAADIRIRKRVAKKIWDEMKEMGCCGVGFYGGDSLHIDTGPARFWTQETSKVRTNISENNKVIMVRTNQDVYFPGEPVMFKLARITAYPVGVKPTFMVVGNGRSPREFSFDGKDGACLPVREPTERTFVWTVPQDLPLAGRVHVQLRFCDKQFPEMPDQIESNIIEVRSPR